MLEDGVIDSKSNFQYQGEKRKNSCSYIEYFQRRDWQIILKYWRTQVQMVIVHNLIIFTSLINLI